MKHIKLKARRMSEKDRDGMTFYHYETTIEVDGEELENVTAVELEWSVLDDVPRVKVTFIPESLEIDAEAPE